MKKRLNKLLSKFGYKISKIGPQSDANCIKEKSFQIQKQLINDSIEELIIFDVGAYVGSVAKIYTKLFPRSKIYCFEPFPDSFLKLKENTSLNKNIYTFNYGFSDEEGITSFQVNSSSPTNSLLKTSALSGNFWSQDLLKTINSVDVKMRTLDNFINDHKIEKIDILKLDVQGAEFMVLKGALESLEKRIVKMIYTEIITLPTYEGQKHFDEILNLMRNLRYELYDFYNYSYTPKGQLRQVDAIFLLKS